MRVVIPFPPITKKNSQRIIRAGSRSLITQSEQYVAYERDCMLYLAKYRPEKPIDYPVNVKEIYYMPSLRRVDLLNLQAATDDILVKAGILVDDNSKIVVSHDGSRVRIDRKNPRTEIWIERSMDEQRARET